jgi:hypothetical protein
MLNKTIVQHLDNIADYYITASDLVRTRSFRAAARNIELITFTITQDNFQDVTFKGLGDGIKEVIKDYLSQGTSKRLEELKESHPPLSALSLLSLYNIDLEYIKHLWITHKAKSIKDLASVSERRASLALEKMQERPNLFHPRHNTKFVPDVHLLGDMAIASAYGAGKQTIDSIAEELSRMGDKHIFIADRLASPNVLVSISEERLSSQREVIRKAQIDHNIRIWQGAIVDVDLEGNPIANSIEDRVEFVILKLETEPHTNKLSRLKKAYNSFKDKSNILIDCLDIYCAETSRGEFKRFLDETTATIVLSGDSVANIAIQEYLKPTIDLKEIRLPKVALAGYATSAEELDRLFTASELASKLGYQKEDIINCLPKPFHAPSLSKNIVGVRDNNTETKEDASERIQAAIKKIDNLRKVGSSLGDLFNRKINE